MGDLLRGLLRRLGDSLRTTNDFLVGILVGLVDLCELLRLDDLLPELDSEFAGALSGDFLVPGPFFCKLGDLLRGLLLGLSDLLPLRGLSDLIRGLGDLFRTTGDFLCGLGNFL